MTGAGLLVVVVCMADHDERFMRMALDQAQAAADAGEVPVGAILVDPASGEVISTGANGPIASHDPTAHAEIVVLRDAARQLGSERLTDCDLYVTLEPCTMCAGALVLARVERLVFGAYDPKAGAVASLFDVLRDPRLNHRVDVRGGVLEAECSQVLLDFFTGRRGAEQD